MKKKKVIVLNGIHACGKTTVGKLLAAKKGYFFCPEIGAKEREKVDYPKIKNFESYDFNILSKEVARDKKLLLKPGISVIETWHIGNLAYVLKRSPSLKTFGESVLRTALMHFEPIPIFLDINQEVFRRRAQVGITGQDLTGLTAFFRDIKKNIFQIYESFNLNPIIIKNNCSLEILSANIKKELFAKRV